MQYVYYEWGGSLQTGKLITKYADNVNSEPNYHLPAWTYYETQNIIIYWEKKKQDISAAFILYFFIGNIQFREPWSK